MQSTASSAAPPRRFGCAVAIAIAALVALPACGDDGDPSPYDGVAPDVEDDGTTTTSAGRPRPRPTTTRPRRTTTVPSTTAPPATTAAPSTTAPPAVTTPPAPSAPAGQVPPEMVGTWCGGTDRAAHVTFAFGADGAFQRIGGIGPSSGVAVVRGGELTLYGDDGSAATHSVGTEVDPVLGPLLFIDDFSYLVGAC